MATIYNIRCGVYSVVWTPNTLATSGSAFVRIPECQRCLKFSFRKEEKPLFELEKIVLSAQSFFTDEEPIPFNPINSSATQPIVVQSNPPNIYACCFSSNQTMTYNSVEHSWCTRFANKTGDQTLAVSFNIIVDLNPESPHEIQPAYRPAYTVDHFSNLHLNEASADVTLRVRGERFAAHAGILGSASPVFAAMLLRGSKRCAAGRRVFDIEDFEPKVIQHLLRYIYEGHADFDGVRVDELAVAADRYQMAALKLECVNYLGRRRRISIV